MAALFVVNFRNTVLLAVVVALLGAYLYWIERPAIERAKRASLILEFETADVDHVALTSKGETIEATREDGAWKITAPITAPADGRAIETLIRTAAEAQQSRTIEPENGDLAPFGLEEPEAVLQLHRGDVALPSLSIGKGTPIGFSAYARLGQEDVVLLTGGTVRAALVKTLADLREKKILSFDQNDVEQLTIRPRDGPQVELHRATDASAAGTQWQLTAPTAAPAADQAMRSFFSALSALRAVDFLAERGADAEASRGLTPPAYEVRLDGADQKRITIRIGNAVDVGDKELIALTVQGDPQIYLVASHVPSSLGKSANDLRDKRVLRVLPDAVSKIRVRRRDAAGFELARSDSGWTLADGEKTDARAAQRFVDDLLELEGSDIVLEDGTLADLGVPVAEVEIDLVGDEDLLLTTVRLARTDDDGTPRHLASTADKPVVYAVRDFVYSRVTHSPEDLKSTD